MIKAIFDEISAEAGSNKKMEILASYKDNELLKKVLYLANSKRVKFYIKQIPDYEKYGDLMSLEVAIEYISKLYNRELTGHAAQNYLSGILSQLDNNDAYIVECIIEKDCKIGMGTSNINKVFPGLIEKTPYMGAKPFSPDLVKKLFEKSNSLCYSQVKMDGRYCGAIIRSADVELESRQGETTYLEGAKFLEELKQFDDCVLNGELTMTGGISRYESNGIIASLVSISKKSSEGQDVKKEIFEFEKEHMNYQDALNSIKFTVWDCITVDEYFDKKSSIEYKARILNLANIINSNKNQNVEMVSIIEYKIVSSFEEAMEHFQEVLNRGEEGTIIKSENGGWKDGKPNFQVKAKLEIDVDLKIVGFNYGTGKNEKLISSVNAESSDGLVFTRPTGINEKMMQFITENQEILLGSVLEVKCCGLSQDSEGNYALLHPVFKQIRDDKNDCDSLEDIKKIENMAKGLL